MIRCHCNAPAIYQGACLFHQSPDGVRPNIDTYTGQIRRTPEEQKAAELAARRAMAKEKKAPKVIRPVKERKPKREPDVAAIVKAYEQGQTILEIGRAHNHCQRTVSKILKAAGCTVVHQAGSNKITQYDEGMRADFRAGMSRKAIAAKYGVGLHVAERAVKGMAPPGPVPTPMPHDLVRSMYLGGQTARQIARTTGCSETRVLRFLKAEGITRGRFGQAA